MVSADKRLQINIRLTALQRERMDALRRLRTPIPSVSQLLRDLAEEEYEREIERATHEEGGEGKKAPIRRKAQHD